MPSPDPQLMTVFSDALERSEPAVRAAYLDGACRGNAELRRLVEELLAAHEGAGRFLEPNSPEAAGTSLAATLPDIKGVVTAGLNASELATGAYQSDRLSSTTAPHRSATETEGTVIAGRYKLLQRIGEGGMGSVWMADQTEPVKRRVAVKLIRMQQGNSRTILTRFEAERQAIALMDHPHIAKLLDAGTTPDGSPFFVMELVKGVPLNEYCDVHTLSIPDRLKLFMQICSAVQHAHQKGIIHRDLKPSNILIECHDGKPVPKVIDFGLAKATSGLQLSENTLFTAFGSVMGTPLYMAPEQANFNAVDVDTRADVYSLGVILYELLTGTTPITRESIKKAALDEMLKLIREQEAPTPSSRLSTVESTPSIAANRQMECQRLGRFVKGELDWIVMKALSKERDRRYESATGFARDIEQFLNNEPVAAGPPSTSYRLRKFVKRNRGQVIAASLVLFTVLAGIVGTALGLICAEHHRAEADLARQREATESTARAIAEKARDDAAAARDRLASVEYGRTMEVAHQEWRENNVATSSNLLNATPKELRGWEWRHVNRLCHLDLLTLKGHTNSVSSASFSPDGTRIVTASWDNTAKVWDARNGTDILTLKGHSNGVISDGVSSTSFSPDGNRIVTAGEDGTAKVWDARNGVEVFTLKGHTGGVRSARFSPDGSRIVTTGDDATAKVWDATRSAEVLTLKGHTSAISSASFSPDGSRIITASFDGTAKVWDATRGAEVLTLKGHTSEISSASFSPDGSRIVTASFDGTARVWDATRGAEVLTLKGHTGHVTAAVFRQDGLQIVTASEDSAAKVWDARSGAEVLTLKGNIGGVTSASFSPDGTRIVTASGNTAKVWDARSDGEVLTLKGNIGGVTSASFSPDGSRIVAAGGNNTARVWDATSGVEILKLKAHTGGLTSASFSPDGSRIVTGTDDSTARVWDARSGAEVMTLGGITDTVLPTGVLPGVALVGDIPFEGVNAACFSPDGTRVVTACGDHMAKVWDARNGVEVLTLKGHSFSVTSASFSPDGSRIVTAGEDGTAKVWDARNGTEVFTLKGHTSTVRSTGFSPDGSRVVTASEDGTAKVWDARNGVEVLTLKGHTGGVTSASFSPDRLRIATGSVDGTAKIWDAKSGVEVLTLKGHTGGVTSASFSPDGSRIVTADSDGTAKVWDTTPINREFSAKKPAPSPGTAK
jgi:WD40 repeat protein/serine/threonine protein kinase